MLSAMRPMFRWQVHEASQIKWRPGAKKEAGSTQGQVMLYTSFLLHVCRESPAPGQVNVLQEGLRSKFNMKLVGEHVADGQSDALQTFQLDFLEKNMAAICSGLRTVFRNEVLLRAVNISKHVQDRFFQSQSQLQGSLLAVFHGTDEANLPSIYQKGQEMSQRFLRMLTLTLMVFCQDSWFQGVAHPFVSNTGPRMAMASTLPRLTMRRCPSDFAAVRSGQSWFVACWMMPRRLPNPNSSGITMSRQSHSVFVTRPASLRHRCAAGESAIMASCASATIKGHVGDAIVVFDEGRVIPLFEAWEPGIGALCATSPRAGAISVPVAPPARPIPLQPFLALVLYLELLEGVPTFKLRKKAYNGGPRSRPSTNCGLQEGEHGITFYCSQLAVLS